MEGLDYEEQFRQAMVGVAITRRDGGFVAVNPAFARLFGHASPEAFMDAVRESASLYAERDEHERTLAALARDGEVRDFEAWMRRRDGELRWISGGLVALKGGLVQWAVLDRTDKRMGRERELALQRLQHLVTLRFGQARSLGEALQAAMRAICETEHWEAARYLYVDEERGVLRAGESWCIPEPTRERYLEESRSMEYRPGQGLVGHVWQTGEPLWVPDIAVDARVARPALAAVHGMRGSVVCPVHAEGRTLGVLIFDSSEVREPDEHLLATLAVIGGQIGLLVRRAQAEQALAASERRLRALIEHGSDAIALYDRALRRVYRSGSAQRITGYTDDERLGGPLMDRVFEDDRPALQAMVDALLAASGSSAPFRCRLLTKSGRLRWVEGVATNLFDEPAVGALVVNYRDIDERMRYESRIEHLASHDALTGLPNRALLRDRVGQAIAHARRTRSHVALMYVDLDQFKLVNDSWGHGAGDALLLEVGARLKAAMRQGDTVARLGGDEFVVLLSSLAHADDCTVVAGKIATALARPVALEGRELQVSASIGIAMYPEDGADLEALLQCADAAMYRAKEAGRNGYQYYSADMGAHARARVELETGLRQALERNELRLHWQPQVELASGEVRGCEALLRWARPGRGLVSPAHFVPAAEESGLIVPIGEWALRAACREAAGWAAAGLGPIRAAVNLSARQFWQGSVVEAVRAALDASGLPPSCLEVEITESVVARDIDKVVNALEQLRRMGVSTAIDDFGTGYSSLAYLRSLPLQKLKIDRYFIHGIPGDREAAALVAEIIRLAHVLSLEVVAEGVETEAQAAFLREAGCESMQGFLFARPMPPAEFAELVRSGRRLVPGNS